MQTLAEKKRKREPIVSLTAYDYATARLADEAGVDLILVGDSLAQVVLGYDSTLPVTMEEMLHHTRAVRRAVRHALLVADMPFGSYHSGARKAVENAVRFVKEGGAEAVKIEGGTSRVPLIRRIIDAEIPVIGHIGLTPQSVHRMGGYKVQGKTAQAIDALLADAVALDARRRCRDRPGRHSARSCRPHQPRGCDPHHRHRRRPGLRRPDPGLSRSRRTHLHIHRPSSCAAIAMRAN